MKQASRRAGQLKIPLSRDEQVGTGEHPYRLADPAAARRRAIEAGLERRIRAAHTELKRRLNVLRIYHRNRRTCGAVEDDMRWFDATHYPGGRTRPACATRAAARSAG